MKYFIVEGILKNREKMDAQLMLAHKKYTQKAMDIKEVFSFQV